MNIETRSCDTPAASDISIATPPTVDLMSTRYRRRRGTPVEDLFVKVSPDVFAKIDELSAALDVPKWAIVEQAILAAEPDANGVPRGWQLPTRGEELPIQFAA